MWYSRSFFIVNIAVCTCLCQTPYLFLFATHCPWQPQVHFAFRLSLHCSVNKLTCTTVLDPTDKQLTWYFSLPELLTQGDTLGLSMLLQMASLRSFYGWVIFHCMYVPYFYPFLCWWTLRLLPCPGCWVLQWTSGCMYHFKPCVSLYIGLEVELLNHTLDKSYARASLVAQMVKNLPTMWETQVQSLGQEDPLKKGLATHVSILAWRIPWTEEPGGLWLSN